MVRGFLRVKYLQKLYFIFLVSRKRLAHSIGTGHAEPIPEEDRFLEEAELPQKTTSNPLLERIKVDHSLMPAAVDYDSAPNTPTKNNLEV